MRRKRNRDGRKAVGGVVATMAVLAMGVLLLSHGSAGEGQAVAAQATKGRVPADQVPLGGAPVFEEDPNWPPKSLPNNWVLPAGLGVAVDSLDHPWFLHSPTSEPPAGKQAASPVLEFDGDGNLLQAWGGPVSTPRFRRGIAWKPPAYTWMELSAAPLPYGGYREHGIAVDHEDNVWVAGNGHVVLKFTRDGEFLLQIGQLWHTNGSNDSKLLGGPTGVAVDPATNEVFVSDGYINRRVIVFDGNTGAYKRHWGAYGMRPENDDPIYPDRAFHPDGVIPQELSSVHCARLSKDELLYVCDRERNRVQVFRTDGTFVSEVFVDKEKYYPHQPGYGTTWDVAFSVDPEQRYLYVADWGINLPTFTIPSENRVWIFRRRDLRLLGSVEGAGAHQIAVDSKGSLYTATMKKFLFKGVPTDVAGGLHYERAVVPDA